MYHCVMRNIEIKLCRPENLYQETLARLLRRANATFIWERHQRDTFWQTQNGWLKLREVIGDADSSRTTNASRTNSELIGYRRSTENSDARPSDYYIVEIGDPESLMAALDSTLGQIGVVEKQRELWLWRQTRIHVDQVVDLGSFVELETVLGEIDETTGRQQMRECRRLLQLEAAERLARPYLELLSVH